MANSMKVDLIKLLRFLWPSSGTRFMKRYAPASLKDYLPLAARFTEATPGLQTENGRLPAHLRQKKDLQKRWRLAMTIRISRQYCDAPDQELDQNRRSPPLPFLRQPTRQQRPPRRPRLRRLLPFQNRVVRTMTMTMTKTGLYCDGENSLLLAQKKSLTTQQPCLLQLAWERKICQLQTLANKRLLGKSQLCR